MRVEVLMTGLKDIFSKPVSYLLSGQGKGKPGPFIQDTLTPYFPPMSFNDSLDNGQTDTGTLKLC